MSGCALHSSNSFVNGAARLVSYVFMSFDGQVPCGSMEPAKKLIKPSHMLQIHKKYAMVPVLRKFTTSFSLSEKIF